MTRTNADILPNGKQRMGLIVFAALLVLPLVAGAEENTDLTTIHQIKKEAFENSRVMDHLFYLVDVNGRGRRGRPDFKRQPIGPSNASVSGDCKTSSRRNGSRTARVGQRAGFPRIWWNLSMRR